MAIVRKTPWLLRALTIAREVDAPDWLIGAGAVRTAVWDRLHGYDGPPALADVDLVFFDPGTCQPNETPRSNRRSARSPPTVVAPCGLDDLLGLVHRRTPRRVTVAEHERRLAAKRIAKRWPRATIVPAR